MKPSIKEQIESVVSLFDYTEYRHFLKDYFAERKKIDQDFSYKLAAESMGFNSRGYVHQIISGAVAKLNVSQIFRMTEYFEFGDDEREYFFNMVFLNQSENEKEKEYFYSRMNDYVDPRRGQSLHKSQYEYFSKWYIPVIRELVTMKDFDGSITRLAKKLNPPISVEECRQGLDVLLDLGLIDKTRAGRYFQTQVSLHTGPEVQALAWRKFIEESARLGREALERHPTRDRDLSGITFGVTEDGVRLLRSMLYNLKKEIAQQIPEWDDQMDRVYQLNLQLFPLSKIPARKNS